MVAEHEVLVFEGKVSCRLTSTKWAYCEGIVGRLKCIVVFVLSTNARSVDEDMSGSLGQVPLLGTGETK